MAFIKVGNILQTRSYNIENKWKWRDLGIENERKHGKNLSEMKVRPNEN